MLTTSASVSLAVTGAVLLAAVLVAVGAAIFVGEQLSVIRLVGVVIISIGLGTLVFVGGVPTRAARPAIAPAVLTGVVIAMYTTV